LRFGRWLRQAPYLPHCGVLAHTAHTDRLAQLPAEEQYAAVELFRGTMLRHSAILSRADNPTQAQAIQFADDGWLSYIPQRLPGTIIVEERSPPGAAAVLINQNHTDTDLYLPVNLEEKRLVEAIDGKRSIRELAHPRHLKQQDGLRALIQKLWWYDQIVFDASRQ
jgi:hypothetical protein